MPRLGVACQFRHDPAADGAMIPASQLITDGPRKDQVMPIIGYLAYSLNGEVRWSFIKYEAPVAWQPEWHRQNVRGQIATTRVASVFCPKCAESMLAPVHGESRARCPKCGGQAEASFIKERSEEFDRMVGSLRAPLEAAAVAAESSAVDFEFPQVVVTAMGIGMSPSIPATYAGKVDAAGYGAKDLKEVSGFDEMLGLRFKSPALSIVPDLVSGSVELSSAKAGVSQSWPVLSTWMKLWVPEERQRGPVPFQVIRF